MSARRRKEITRHLPEETIDEKLTETDDDHIVRRISFVKNLYLGDTLKDAAERAGRSELTGSRWAEQWNKDSLAEFVPSFRGDRPPKLDKGERQQLIEQLPDSQPWKSPEIQHLFTTEFDVEYHPAHLSEFLRKLGLSYSIPRAKRPSRPDNAEEMLDVDKNDKPHNKRAGNDDIKGISVMGENPTVSEPNVAHAREILKNPDFLCIQDIFLIDTAQYADIMLSATSFIESNDTFTSSTRRVQLTNRR